MWAEVCKNQGWSQFNSTRCDKSIDVKFIILRPLVQELHLNSKVDKITFEPSFRKLFKILYLLKSGCKIINLTSLNLSHRVLLN